MADLKITELTDLGAATSREDLLFLIDDPEGVPDNVKVSIGDAANALAAPVALTDAALTLTEAAHAGRYLIGFNLTADRIITLPTPIAGMEFRFLGPAVMTGADNFDLQIKCATTDGSVRFDGQLTHHDTNETGQTTVVVFPDVNSNDFLNIHIPLHYDITIIGRSATLWHVTGFVSSNTAPTFADAAD